MTGQIFQPLWRVFALTTLQLRGNLLDVLLHGSVIALIVSSKGVVKEDKILSCHFQLHMKETHRVIT